MKSKFDILIYEDKSVIINTIDIDDVKESLYYDKILYGLEILSDKVNDVYYTNNHKEVFAEVVDRDRNIHTGRLIEYNQDYVILEVTNNVQFIIKNVISVNIIKNIGTVVRFSQPGRKLIMYNEPDIFYDIVYTIYIKNNNTTHLIQNIKIHNDTNEVKDYSSASIVIGKSVDNKSCNFIQPGGRNISIKNNLNNQPLSFSEKSLYYRSKNNNQESYNEIDQAKNISINKEIDIISNNDSYFNPFNQSSSSHLDLEIIKLSGGNPISIPKKADINVTDTTLLPGKRVFIINSTNTKEPIDYGFIVVPEINIYPAKALFFDQIDGKNILIASTYLKRMQKGLKSKIIIGKTTSIEPKIKINRNTIKTENENEYKIIYNFNVLYENLNPYPSLILFEHEINDRNFENVEVQGTVISNRVIWEDTIQPLSSTNIVYNLSYYVKEKK